MKKLILTLVLLIIASQAQAANWYVRPSGGSGSGTNWTTAWNGLSGIGWSSVACGDTIWVAGGSYAQDMSPAKNCSSGSPLYVRRARADASECTGATGWSSGYDATVVQPNKSIIFPTSTTNNYITISGRTTASGGTYGWQIHYSSVTSGNGIEFENGSTTNHITIEYMDVYGPTLPSGNYSDDARGIDDTPGSGSASYHTFSHMAVHGWESGMYVAYGDYHVSEYIDMYDIYSDGTMHPNLYYIIDSNNGFIRYSKFHDSAASGTGIAFSDGGPFNNWTVYGNQFYDMTGTYGTSLSVQDTAIVGLKIYNNTFANTYNNLNLASASCGSGCETKNNIFFGSGGAFTCGTSSNNLTSSTTGIFTNYAGKNFHIVSTISSGYPRNIGTSESAYFTTDMDGVAFGGDGTWDVGSYEYYSGGTTTYTVSTSEGVHSHITPTSALVSSGSTTTFQITADTGYTAAGTGCSGSLAGTTYTTGSISSNCTVTASASETPRLSNAARGAVGRGIRGR